MDGAEPLESLIIRVCPTVAIGGRGRLELVAEGVADRGPDVAPGEPGAVGGGAFGLEGGPGAAEGPGRPPLDAEGGEEGVLVEVLEAEPGVGRRARWMAVGSKEPDIRYVGARA